MMNALTRTLALVLLSAAPAVCSGCLFGGDDDKDKGAMTSSMDDGGANNVDAVISTPPSPWRSIELRQEEGSSVGVLPIVALVVSLLALGLVVTPWILHRRRHAPPA
jgi:hypothetical protein